MATARPIPRDPPVTNAICPDSSGICSPSSGIFPPSVRMGRACVRGLYLAYTAPCIRRPPPRPACAGRPSAGARALITGYAGPRWSPPVLLVHESDGDAWVADGPQGRDEALTVRAGLELLLSGW
ncbi:hypothetical protein GCM10023323_06230 [Streptomyces thinghirensis]|uniref:Uncharacterized protein n=1 Tax=Streptomyces thinghirensis TaxID=551547 RepID=A0ABP9SYZ1_9ACTN